VNEKLNGTGVDSFKQVYTYDRWGNRSVSSNLSSANVPRPAYTIDPNTNRLLAPAGYNFGYDNAGNQTNDTYTGGGQRTFDAQNHMTSAQENSGWQYYKYSGSGLRVRRIVNAVEVWQAYGIGGELLAEYPAKGAVTKPQKEYGYRNGQLLITAEPAVGTRTNFALAANGSVASASSTHPAYSLAAINNGDRKGINYGGIWADATSNEYPDSVQIDFGGSKTIDEVALISMQDNYANPVEPTQTMQGSNYVVTSFRVEYWSESGWQTVPNGLVTSNNLILRRVTFPALTTNKIKITINATGDNYSQIPEIEVYGYARANVALAANGGVTSASSTYPTRAVANVNNGDRKGPNHGGIWGDNTSWQYPDWVQIDLAAKKVIDEVAVFSVQDNGFSSSGEPTPTMTGNQYVVQNFEIWYWNGNDWATTPAMQVTGNNLIWRKLTFPSVLTNKLRIIINSTGDNYSQISEIEVYGSDSGPVNWLVSDHLGTPRMIVDESGSLANMQRHDYLPFGEEIGSAQVALIGGRSGTHGYVAGNARQKFTGYEADSETGLYYAHARYQSSMQGRFTGVDPLGASASIGDPQSFNRYSYVQNTPLTAVDPTGMALSDIGVYQTNNPEVADIIHRKTTPMPQTRRKNPKLPEPRGAVVPDGLPPPPGGPVSTTPPKIDVGDPPSCDVNVSVTRGPLEAPINQELAPNLYATGVRAMLTIKITDRSGKPLVGWKVVESNRTLESVPDIPILGSPQTSTTDSNGTIQDYFAANAIFTNYRLTPEEGEAVVFKQIESRSHALIEQTLRISSPDGGVVAVAVYMRRISNLENGNVHGNLIPPFNSRGNHVNNFQVTLFRVSVTCPGGQR
jgi:RHS repeat-associated protein